MVADHSTARSTAAASPSPAALLTIVLLPDQVQEIEGARVPADQMRRLSRTFGMTMGSVFAGITAAVFTLYVVHGSPVLVFGELMLAPGAMVLTATGSHAQARRRSKRRAASRETAVRRG